MPSPAPRAAYEIPVLQVRPHRTPIHLPRVRASHLRRLPTHPSHPTTAQGAAVTAAKLIFVLLLILIGVLL